MSAFLFKDQLLINACFFDATVGQRIFRFLGLLIFIGD